MRWPLILIRSLIFLLMIVCIGMIPNSGRVSAFQLDSYFEAMEQGSAFPESATENLNNGLTPLPEGGSLTKIALVAPPMVPTKFAWTYGDWSDSSFEQSETWQMIKADHRCFYSGSSVRMMVSGLGVGAILAHSGADERFRRWQHNDSQSGSPNDFSGFAKQFGEGKYVLPTLASCYLIGNLATGRIDLIYLDDLAEWGKRGVRGAIIGLPALAVGQLVVGASRPEENRGARWRPFQDDNGISGHSFMGALPFLTAANLTESRLAKTGLIFCSTLPAWSRLQDDAHYLSQAVLGWGLAYLACRSVDQADRQMNQWQLHPTLIEHGAGGDLGLGISLDY
jgi:hypothetical protein